MADESTAHRPIWRRRRVWLGGLVGVIVLSVGLGWTHLPTRAVQWAVDRGLIKLRAGGPRHANWLPAKFGHRSAKLSEYAAGFGASSETTSILRLIDIVPTGGADDVADRFIVDLDGQRRSGIGGKVPFDFRVKFKVPEDGELWLSLNSDHSALGGLDVRFRVTLVAGDDERELLDREHAALRSGWENVRVDLSAWGGKEVQLNFAAAFAPAGGDEASGEASESGRSVRGFWGDLVVRSRSANRDRPNIVVLLLDTLRPDHLGAYGYARETSPNIDALAESGVRFDHAISSAPWTDPSIASLFTGLNPSDMWEPAPHKTWRRRRLPDEPATLAGVLAEAGYFTMAASDHPGINANRFGRGFDVYASLYHEDGRYSNWRKTAPRKLLSRVERLLQARRGDGLLLYLHLIYPHVPYNAPQGYADLFGPGAEVFHRSNRDGLINLYDAEIRLTDDVVGVLLDMFADHGLKDNTILAIVSDHGEGFWEHGLYEHGNSLYNELLKITLILHGPGHVPSGVVVKDVVRMIDVMPTLLELAGVAVPAGVRGMSMVGLMRGEPGEARPAYSEFPHSRIVTGHSIQSKTLKVIVPESGQEGREIYDLDRDPGEQMPLVDQSSEGTALLFGTMRALRAAAEAHRDALDTTEQTPSKEMVEKLRALGYTD